MGSDASMGIEANGNSTPRASPDLSTNPTSQTIDMRSRKRPASAHADEDLGASISKHVKVEYEEADSLATVPNSSYPDNLTNDTRQYVKVEQKEVGYTGAVPESFCDDGFVDENQQQAKIEQDTYGSSDTIPESSCAGDSINDDRQPAGVEQEDAGSPSTIPESTSIPAPSDDIDLLPVSKVNLAISQDPVASANTDQPPLNLTTIALPNSQDITGSLSRYIEQMEKAVRDRDAVIDQLRNSHRNDSDPASIIVHGPISPGNTTSTEPDINPHETRSRSTELRDAKKRIKEQEVLIHKHEHKIQEQQATIRKQKDTIRCNETAIQEHVTTIQEYEDNSQILQQRWQQAEAELQEAKQKSSSDFTSSEDIDDNLVLEQFKVLSNRIKNLAGLYFSGTPLVKIAKSEFKGFFDGITPKWGEGYLKEKRRKQYFIEAVIWNTLIDRFLYSPTVIWNEDVGVGLFDLHSRLWCLRPRANESLQRYHSVRLQLAELHLQVQGRNGLYLGKSGMAVKNRAEIVRDLRERLNNYTDNISKCQQEFRIIVDKAVELAYSMAMAKAYYAVRIGSGLHTSALHGMSFRPSSMKTVAALDPGDEIVELVVSPALIRHGTSEGEDYHKSADTLEKACVFCK